MKPRHPLLLGAVVLLVLATGCSRRNPVAEPGRDVRRAAASYTLAREALAEEDIDAAKGHLRDALRWDEYHGPAHNDLGVLALQDGRLYDAAQHFDLARKYMPGDPRPRRNLAVALDRGGKHREAVAACRAALEVDPDHVPSMQVMARIQLRHHLEDEGTPQLLDTIVQRGETEEWRHWAAAQQLKQKQRRERP